MENGDWTVKTLAVHQEALRRADEKFEEERDRRYGEVKEAEEKALKIKERADEVALGLQRETQQYKDEKANQLREQISSERNLYVTQNDLAGVLRELAAQRAAKAIDSRTVLFATLGFIVALAAVIGPYIH